MTSSLQHFVLSGLVACSSLLACADDHVNRITYAKWRDTHPTGTRADYVTAIAQQTMRQQADSALSAAQTPEQKASVRFQNQQRQDIAHIVGFIAEQTLATDSTDYDVPALTRRIARGVFARGIKITVAQPNDPLAGIYRTYPVQPQQSFVDNLASLQDWIGRTTEGLHTRVARQP